MLPPGNGNLMLHRGRSFGTAIPAFTFQIGQYERDPPMRAPGLILSVLAFAALMVVAPNLVKAQPSVASPLALGQTSEDGVEDVGYRYRRYRYARPYARPYYRPYYQPYYRPYAYYQPYYYRPYNPYYYRPYYRPGISLWFGF